MASKMFGRVSELIERSYGDSTQSPRCAGLFRVIAHVQCRAASTWSSTSVLKTAARLIAVAGLAVCFAFAVNAASFYKCVIDGTVTYQQAPCPSTQVRKGPTVEELNAAEKNRRAAATSNARPAPQAAISVPPAPSAMPSLFRCDGRQHCSQMRSCEEAKFFLANCPGVKMDGNRDGVPCEQQWCSR
jgi:hypothetical protein